MTLRTLTAAVTDRIRASGAEDDTRPADLRGIAGRPAAATVLAGPRPEVASIAMAGVAAGACVASLVMLALGRAPAASATALLVVLCLAPGMAVLPVLGRSTMTWGLGAISSISLAIGILIAEAMLEVGAWEPRASALVLAGLCLPALAFHLATRLRPPPPGHVVALLRTRARRLRVGREPAAHAVVLVGATALWLTAVRGTDLDAMAGFGLLNALPVAFYAAVALLVAGFSWAASRAAPATRLLGVYTVALATLLHGTTSLLYDVPRYSWSYKHIGATELLAAHGDIDRSLDVYNNWPGFFGLGAWVSAATRASASDLAIWAPLFFALAGIAALVFALRAITGDPLIVWTACWLFVVTNWIGQNYYAPQSIAFVLSLVVVGLVLRSPAATAPGRHRLGRRLARLQARLAAWIARNPPPAAETATPLLARGRLLLLATVCFAAIVVTHQLSPFMVLVQVGALALLCGRVPFWLVGLWTAMEAAWVALTLPFLESKFDLLDFSPDAVPQAGVATDRGLPGVAFVNASEPALVLAILALALIGTLLARRTLHLPPVVPILAASPILVIALQQYGGEGTLRVYLFGLPWLCLLAAYLLVALGRRSSSRIRFAALLAGGGALALLFLLAHFGAEQKHYLTRDDVAVATWFEREAPPGAVLTPVIPAYPVYPTGRYPAFVGNGELTGSIVELPGFGNHLLGAIDVERMRRLFTRRTFATRHYVILSGLQERMATLYQAVPDGSFRSLRRALSRQPDFRLVYRSGDGYVYEFRPLSPPGRARLRGYFGSDLDSLFDQVRADSVIVGGRDRRRSPSR